VNQVLLGAYCLALLPLCPAGLGDESCKTKSAKSRSIKTYLTYTLVESQHRTVARMVRGKRRALCSRGYKIAPQYEGAFFQTAGLVPCRRALCPAHFHLRSQSYRCAVTRSPPRSCEPRANDMTYLLTHKAFARRCARSAYLLCQTD